MATGSGPVRGGGSGRTSARQAIHVPAARLSGTRTRARVVRRRGAGKVEFLEAGTDLHTIHRLLGHHRITSTMRYLHLVRQKVTERCSPIDLLELSEPYRGRALSRGLLRRGPAATVCCCAMAFFKGRNKRLVDYAACAG